MTTTNTQTNASATAEKSAQEQGEQMYDTPYGKKTAGLLIQALNQYYTRSYTDEHVEAITAQRDELLEALKQIIGLAAVGVQLYNSTESNRAKIAGARAAIARAEGNK